MEARMRRVTDTWSFLEEEEEVDSLLVMSSFVATIILAVTITKIASILGKRFSPML